MVLNPIVVINPQKLLDRLKLNMDLDVFNNLEVFRYERATRVYAKVKNEFYVKNRDRSKQELERLIEQAKKLDLCARYEPRGRWIEIWAKAS